MKNIFDFVNKVAKQLRDKDFAIADRVSLIRNDENPQTVKNSPSYRPNVLTTSEKLDCNARPADGGNGARNDEICHPELVSGSHTSRKRCAFTLTEVIIVMLVIAVVVAISIKATKAKLSHITSYTYYAAYSTINSVTKEMLKDFNAEDADYTTSHNKFWNLFSSPAFAIGCFYKEDTRCYNYVTHPVSDVLSFYKSGGCTAWHEAQPEGKSSICDTNLYAAYGQAFYPNYVGESSLNTKFANTVASALPSDPLFIAANTSNVCLASWKFAKASSFSAAASCTKDRIAEIQSSNPTLQVVYYLVTELEEPEVGEPNTDPIEPGGGGDTGGGSGGSECTPTPCTGGNTFDTTTCSCVCNQTAPDPIPCGQEWSNEQCQLVDISPWPPVCESGKEFNPDESVCGCVPIPQAIPRTGENYCKLFVSYANTSQLAEDDECKGDAIADDEVDFSDKEPDMILRNGMYLYNVSQDPQKIEALDGNSKGRTYTKTEDDGTITVVDLDEWGYTLYIDIDGARGGNGVLWEDVYPFYVTLSGKVIPAYDTTNAGLSGGDSKLHLQTSVADEYIDDATGHRLDWITKSAPFKTSACAMDYVKAATPYCSTAPAVTTNAQCATTGHDCRLKTIMPVKFFGR